MVKQTKPTKEDLLREAFAIAGEPANPDTWHLPHHKKSIRRALKGTIDVEQTIDWAQVALAVNMLSPLNKAKRVRVSPEDILEAANHLAGHYRKVNKPLPDILAALV